MISIITKVDKRQDTG